MRRAVGAALAPHHDAESSAVRVWLCGGWAELYQSPFLVAGSKCVWTQSTFLLAPISPRSSPMTPMPVTPRAPCFVFLYQWSRRNPWHLNTNTCSLMCLSRMCGAPVRLVLVVTRCAPDRPVFNVGFTLCHTVLRGWTSSSEVFLISESSVWAFDEFADAAQGRKLTLHGGLWFMLVGVVILTVVR